MGIAISSSVFIVVTLLTLLVWAYFAWQNWSRATVWLLALLPLYLWRFTVAAVPSTWFEIALYLTTIAFVVRGYDRVKFLNMCKAMSFLCLPLMLWVTSAVAGVLIAADVRLALGIFKGWIIDPLLYALIFTYAVLQQNDIRQFIRKSFAALLVGSTAVTVCAVCVFALSRLSRLRGVFDSPNVLAMYLAPVVLGVLLWMYYDKTARDWWWFLGAGIVSLGVILTNSYGAWVALLVSFIIWVLYERFGAIAVRLTGAVIVSVGLVMPWLGWWPLPSHGYASGQGPTSGQVRLVLWREATRAITQYPALGLGLGQWQPWFERMGPRQIPEKWQPAYGIELHYASLFPHNLWLTTWLFMGGTGLIALVWLVITAYRHARESLVKFSVVPLFMLGVILVQGIVDTPLYKNDLAILWWVIIILCSIQFQQPVISYESGANRQ